MKNFLILLLAQIILRINPSDPGEEKRMMVSGEFIYGIGFDFADKKMFWSDRLSHSVFSADIDNDGDVENIKLVLHVCKITEKYC